MTEWPMITIALTTYYPKGYAVERWAAARQAIPTWRNLSYNGKVQVLWVDDGSDDSETIDRMGDLLDTMPWPWRLIQHGRKGLGVALNAVFAGCEGPVLYAADDWQLVMPQSLDCWVEMLSDPRWKTCAVRLGMLHPGVSGSMEMGPGCWFLRLAPHNVVCGLLRPSLIGHQFVEVYEAWPEGVSPIEVERIQNNERYCPMQQKNPNLPGIVLGLTEPWWHVESVSLNEIRPKVIK